MSGEESGPSGAVGQPSSAGRGVDVVVAEDSRIQARMLEKVLVEAGHRVRLAEHGGKALDLVRERRPDVIISDIEMPEMDGYTFCKQVKSDPQLRTVPLILLSTLSDPVDIIRGLDAGADNYVTKPYDPAYLLARMGDLLATPLAAEAGNEATLDVTLAGQTFQVKAGRQQVLNLLVSTFENAVSKNRELVVANRDLSLARDELQRSNQELTTLNERISRINAHMTRDLEAAARVQRSLLPDEEVAVPRVGLAWRYVPCQSLAGDFLNVFPLDDEHLGLYVVDVSGHGVPSSLMAVTVGRFLSPKVSDSSLLVRPDGNGGVKLATPAEVAFQLNELFQADEFSGLYFTMLYGVLHVPSGALRYVSAGHTPLAQVRRDGATTLHEMSGFPIGFVPDVEFDEESLSLELGDRIYLYSDGVPEAMNADREQFGDEAMKGVLARCRGADLDASVASLLAEVEAWCVPNGPLDDVSILGLEWQGSNG
jgi:sigma-B regulation protein RsbU (phosphoserine phosphatase)